MNAPAAARSRRLEFGLGSLLVLLVLALFGRTGGFDFVNYDDPSYVTHNPAVREGLSTSGLRWAFTEFHSSNWHPLTWLSHMLDVELFGLDPGPHHLVSVALHALNALLFFLFLTQGTGRPILAFFAAAFFALHPLRVESVAWVAERKDVLSGTFFFLLLLAYARWARKPGVLGYLAVVVLFALGLAAKPMLVTAPFVLMLVDLWPLRRLALAGGSVSVRSALLEKLPLLALALASCTVTVLAQRMGGSIGSVEALPLATRAANAAASIFAYLRLALLPRGLACFYPHPALVSGDLRPTLWIPAALGVVLVLGIGAWAFVLARRASVLAPIVTVGWLWFLGMLLPVIGLVQVGSQAYADRYTYLPLAGIAIAVVYGASEATRAHPLWRPALAGLALVLLVLYGASTFRQVATWRSSETLGRHALEVTSSNYVAHTNLGLVYNDRREFARAEDEFRKALQLNPTFLEARFNLGVALQNQGRDDEARECYESYLKKRPADSRALAHLALLRLRSGDAAAAKAELEHALELDPENVLAALELARIALADNEPAKAEAYCRRALAAEPDSREAHLLAGEAAQRLNDSREALEHFQRAYELDPLGAEACFRLANALADAAGADPRRLEQALPLAERALELDPSSAGANVLVAKFALLHDDPARAKSLLERAFQADPGHSEAHDLQGNLLLKEKRVDEAERHFLAALESDPSNANALNNLGFLYDSTGRMAEACVVYERLLDSHAASPFAYPAARGLAWIRATAPDEELRNAAQAEKWARFALEGASEDELAVYLEVLAAALAEAGKFEEAIQAQEQALAQAANPQQRKGIEARLLLYRERKPFRRAR